MAAQPAQEISVTLTAAQVQHVMRAASRSGAPGLHTLLASAGAYVGADAGADVGASPVPIDPRLSRSLLRGLAVLARFGPGASERGVVELAEELSMPPSTAHRYVLTLVESGLLERVPGTRRYRLAGSADGRKQG